MESERHWETCIANDEYEIDVEYPHEVRRRADGKVMKESASNIGYVQLTMGGKTMLKHRVVAMQWVFNVDEKVEVDHIDHDKTNNRIENLRWVTRSENLQNRAEFTRQVNEYVDELPETAVELETYNGNTYDRYWFDYSSERLIVLTRGKYKYVNITKTGTLQSVCIRDVHGKNRCCGWNKLVAEMSMRIV